MAMTKSTSVNSTLQQYIDEKGSLSISNARNLFIQILAQIEELHSSKRSHRKIALSDVIFADKCDNPSKISKSSVYLSADIFSMESDDTDFDIIASRDVCSLGTMLSAMLANDVDESSALECSARDLISRMLLADDVASASNNQDALLQLADIKNHAFVLGGGDVSVHQEAPHKYTLKQKILYALRSTKLRPIPSQKEMQESFAFFEKTQRCFKQYDVIIDVCASHGLIAYLYTIFCQTKHVYIIDAHKPASFNAIGEALQSDPQRIEYIEQDLHDALPALLRFWRHRNSGDENYRICVLACHACSHLSDAIMDICYAHDLTEFALMPCCHANNAYNNTVGCIVQTLNSDIQSRSPRNVSRAVDAGMVKDLIAFGRGIQMGYNMRWKQIPATVTPQNRILIGLKLDDKQIQTQHSVRTCRDVRMRQNYQKTNDATHKQKSMRKNCK